MIWLSLAFAQDDLDRAYQKEFAYLVAEKRSLEQRRKEVQRDGQERLRGAERAIDALQGRLLALERQADKVEARIEIGEQAAQAAEERADLVDNTVSQATEALGVDIAEDASDEVRLAAVFTAAATTLDKAGALSVAEGDYFRPDGSRVTGPIVTVGQIAAYGAAPDAAGSLLPLGDGRLVLRASGGADTARALATGTPPKSLDLFLVESFDKPVSEPVERTVRDVMDGGGVVGWVIVILGLVALLLAVLRAGILLVAGRGRHLEDAVVTALAEGDLERARSVASAGSGPLARVLASVLRPDGLDREGLRDVASEALLRETPAIERFGAPIFVVAAVAPLLGLLGTVTGMIATFEIITEFGTGDPGMLSGGIGEALITTQLGLIVAIPAVLLGNLLKGRSDGVLDTLERAALRVVNARVDLVPPVEVPRSVAAK